MHHQTYKLLVTMPSLLMLYLKHRKDEAAGLEVWHKVLEGVASHAGDTQSAFSVLLNAADNGSLPSYLRPRGEELHDAVGGLLT